MAKCYMCENESTSKEHTPPQSFFPKGKRTNLITVPSCSTHNEETSMDDEYARNIVTSSIENNQTSIDHFFDKSLRSFQRHPGLVKPIIESLREVADYKEGAQAFQIDRARFDRVFRKIAYALFYHEFGYSWKRLLAVMTNQIKMTDMSNDHLGDMFEEIKDDLNGLTWKGENPLVFQYSFLKFKEGEFDYALFMIFHEGFPVWIMPDTDSDHADFD